MKTVLAVDDEFDLTSTIRAILEGEGYRLEVCANGREALDRMTAIRPDLVLLDVMLPVVDGYGVLATMRQTTELADVPVVLMNSFPPKRNDGDWQGCLRKPFRLGTLLDAVRQVIPEEETVRRNRRATPRRLDPGGVTAIRRG
jgi:CheY-like chemotaxis protein